MQSEIGLPRCTGYLREIWIVRWSSWATSIQLKERMSSSNGKLAAITGSSRGIGRAIALRLAKEGYDLLLISRKSEDLDNTAQRIRIEAGRIVTVYYADLLDETETLKAVQGHNVDVLVNCGIYQGPGESVRVDQLEMNELNKLFQGNVLTQVALVKEVLKGMTSRGFGAIIQLVSSSSRTAPTRAIDKGGFQSFGYTATKAAIAKLVPILALEYESYFPALRFFNVDPGLVITDKMRAQGTAARFEKWGASSPEMTAEIVAFLLGPPGTPKLKQLNGAEFVDAPKLFLSFQPQPKL